MFLSWRIVVIMRNFMVAFLSILGADSRQNELPTAERRIVDRFRYCKRRQQATLLHVGEPCVTNVDRQLSDRMSRSTKYASLCLADRPVQAHSNSCAICFLGLVFPNIILANRRPLRV